MDIHTVYALFQRYFRKRRMRYFVEALDVKSSDNIIDVGGHELNWTFLAMEPRVVLVNLDAEQSRDGRFTRIKGDGRLLAFSDASFDIAYSNSVIEHVGAWPDQVAFAHEIARVAPSYFVQTPNRRFFVEPHFIAPFVHYFPAKLARKVIRNFTVWGWIIRPTQKEVDEALLGIKLLDMAAMRQLFPDAEIHREKFFGMTKSIIAIRRRRTVSSLGGL